MDGPQQQMAKLANGFSLEYIDKRESTSSTGFNGIIVLLHGFPQTAYQFRRVLQPFAEEGSDIPNLHTQCL